MSQIRNDPGLCVRERNKENIQRRVPVINRKTDVEVDSRERRKESLDPSKRCPIHPNDFHALNKCRTFRTKPMKERTDVLVKHGICFKCCNSAEHFSKNCYEKVACSVCASNSHPSALHIDYGRPQGGEQKENSSACVSSPSIRLLSLRLITPLLAVKQSKPRTASTLMSATITF